MSSNKVYLSSFCWFLKLKILFKFITASQFDPKISSYIILENSDPNLVGSTLETYPIVAYDNLPRFLILQLESPLIVRTDILTPLFYAYYPTLS